jgi:hypothetical protein
MTMVKVRDLSGTAFDYAAAKACIGAERWFPKASLNAILELKASNSLEMGDTVMRAKGVSVEFVNATRWNAYIGPDKRNLMPGSTPTRAILRCVIASKYGDSIDIPQEAIDGGIRSSIS